MAFGFADYFEGFEPRLGEDFEFADLKTSERRSIGRSALDQRSRLRATRILDLHLQVVQQARHHLNFCGMDLDKILVIWRVHRLSEKDGGHLSRFFDEFTVDINICDSACRWQLTVCEAEADEENE